MTFRFTSLFQMAYNIVIYHIYTKYSNTLTGTHTLSRATALSKLLSLPSEKGSSLKGKNLLPLGANSFLLE